jgi:hypothetical protein
MAPTNLTREDRLRVMLLSGVAERTLKNFLEGRARPASAKRIERALAELRRAPAEPTQQGEP